MERVSPGESISTYILLHQIKSGSSHLMKVKHRILDFRFYVAWYNVVVPTLQTIFGLILNVLICIRDGWYTLINTLLLTPMGRGELHLLVVSIPTG
jgi:hypothetical protein